jgi:TMPIT-like protein
MSSLNKLHVLSVLTKELSNRYNHLANEINELELECSKRLRIEESRLNKDPNEDDSRLLSYIKNQLPSSPHFMLVLALGSTAPMRLRPLSRRLVYKREYEEFQFNSTILAFLMQLLVYITANRVLEVFNFAILIYCYSTTILRQHILCVNGSRIRSWWTLHHYLVVLMLWIMLVSPSTPSFKRIMNPFNLFGIYICAVKFLQYRYQQQRLKTLVALDTAVPMDTIGGQGEITQVETPFVLLIPFLVLAQVCYPYSGLADGIIGMDVGIARL